MQSVQQDAPPSWDERLDRLYGEKEDRPRKFSVALLLSVPFTVDGVRVPPMAEQMTRVPGAYVRHMDGAAIVACVCGRRPILERGELVACERARAWVPKRGECPRWFIWANREVLTFGGKQ